MYTAILVDDEYWALEGLALTFPWENYGFQLVFKTNDPHEAVNQAILHSPDLIVTDIRMHDLSGIDLMRKLQDEGLDSLFVVVSGYADFEYARASLRSRAFDYLLKPVDVHTAREVLAKVKAKLDEKYRSEKHNNERKAVATSLKTGNAQFAQLLEYIQEHYGDMLHITKLSKKFYINTSYCCKLFQENFGMTFSDYVKAIRMEKAATFIQNGLPVKEVSIKTGYTDYYYFMKAFKRYYGVTPHKYSKSHKIDSE